MNSSLLQSLNTHAPYRTLISKRPPAPWVTIAIKQQIKVRERLRNTLRRNHNVINRQLFNAQRNKVQNMLIQSRNDYNMSQLANCSSPRDHWILLKKLGMIKTKTNDKPLPFSAEDLNDYFSSITSVGNPLNDIETFLHNTPDTQLERFYFNHITLDMFLKAFLSSKSTSVGIDKISWITLETALPVILPLILDLLNLSLDNSTFPNLWKKAILIPIPKINNPKTLGDYRPISLLPVLSKILEKIVYNQISTYLNDHSLLDVNQAGFKPGYSTQTTLLKVVDDAKQEIENSKITILVLFDFSKAFDMVDYNLLLDKMKNLNFSNQALEWFHSYFTGRQHAVKDQKDGLSDWKYMKRGVPQGSGLGPLTFLIFINLISLILRFMKCKLYADDLQAYMSCYLSELDRTLLQVESDVINVDNWSRVNGLSLNIAKTKILILGSKPNMRQINFDTLHGINIGNMVIPYVHSARNLGVVIAGNLDWSQQVSDISRKIFISLKRFKSAAGALSFWVRVRLVSSIIIPYLDYCCLLLLDITDELNLILQRALNT